MFHVINLKLDIEPSVTLHRLAAANEVAARCVTLHPTDGTYQVVMNIYAQAGLTLMT